MSGGNPETAVKMLEGVSAGADTLSTYTNSRAKKGQALYNAAMAELEAEDARGVGNSKAARVAGQADSAVAKVRTQIAGRGFQGGVGTAATLEDATDYASRLDALTIRENTNKAVMAKRAEAGGYRNQADSINPGADAAGTMIGHAGLLARRWQTSAADQPADSGAPTVNDLPTRRRRR
jgi:hypothetical protein